MSALSGPVRTCQHMVECYVKHKVAFELENRRLDANLWQELDNFSLLFSLLICCFVLAWVKFLFMEDTEADVVKFLRRSPIVINLSVNLSECIAQMSDSTSGQIETFVKRQGKFDCIF